MQLFEKIRFIRQLKGWSQEEVAHQLNMSSSGYGSIERGECDIKLSKLAEIAKIFGISLIELFNLNERNIFHVGEHNTLQNLSNINSSWSNSTFEYDIQKLQLINEQLSKEVNYLKQQNADLREMVSLLRKGM